MAKPSQVSSSKASTGRRSRAVTRRRSPASSGTDGVLQAAAIVGGKLVEVEGDEALRKIPEWLKATDPKVWVDLSGPSHEQMEVVGTALGLHPLIVEDVIEGNQRAKIETTDGLVHIVLFAFHRGEHTLIHEIDLVLSKGFLLSVHDPDWDPREAHHLREGLESVLTHGSDRLLWAISDDIVDGYFPYADQLGDAIDEVQDAVIRKATPDTLERLFGLKRELVEVRRASAPTREVFNQLTNRELELIDPEDLIYFRDVYDHVIRLTDELDNYRELASATLDVYLTQVNNNLSVIMKRLTGVTVILAGIGAWAGIFGMSEAGSAFGGAEAAGFWIVTAFAIVSAVVAVFVLRKIDWI